MNTQTRRTAADRDPRYTSTIHPMLRDLYADMSDGDRWGDAIGFMFGVCEALYHEGEEVPAEWEFRHGPMDCGLDSEDLSDESLIEEIPWADLELTRGLRDGLFSSADLERFGWILHRLLGVYRAQGLDY